MMRLLILLIVSLFIVFPGQAYGHSIGQSPYFKVNGVFTDYYPVPAVSASDFKLPNDIAPGVFLAGEAIEFEIDTNALPVPPEVVERTTFLWEFGDGSKAQGLKNTHTYQKPGTYFLDLYADSTQGFEPQLLQSTAINVLPFADYKLPKAVIEVNGKQSKDPLLDIIDVNFSESQKFSALKSDPGTSEIVSYEWDLGDMQKSQGAEVEYSYNQNQYTVFPVLRIRTKDGFTADSFVQIRDENAFSESGESGNFSNGLNWKIISGIVLLSLLLSAVLSWLIVKIISKIYKNRAKH